MKLFSAAIVAFMAVSTQAVNLQSRPEGDDDDQIVVTKMPQLLNGLSLDQMNLGDLDMRVLSAAQERLSETLDIKDEEDDISDDTYLDLDEDEDLSLGDDLGLKLDLGIPSMPKEMALGVPQMPEREELDLSMPSLQRDMELEEDLKMGSLRDLQGNLDFAVPEAIQDMSTLSETRSVEAIVPQAVPEEIQDMMSLGSLRGLETIESKGIPEGMEDLLEPRSLDDLEDMRELAAQKPEVPQIASKPARVEEEEGDDVTSICIPDAKEGCVLTMSVDLDEGVVNFVNVPEKLVEKITEEAAEAEAEE